MTVLGNFVPYRTREFTQNEDGVAATAESMADPAYHAWRSMAIEDGAFARRSIGQGDLFHSSNDVSTGDPVFTEAVVGNMDPASADNYLAGRFYGTGGMEVGVVFHEDGVLTMKDVGTDAAMQ